MSTSQLLDRKPVLVARSLCKAYSTVQVLDDVSVTVYGGSIHGIVGHNGAGKSTLFKILVGAVAPDSGSITIDDNTLYRMSARHAFRLGVELIPQEPTLVPAFTVAENIVLGSYPASAGRVKWRSVTKRAAAIAERVGLQAPVDKVAADLSPVDQRLAMVARAIFHGRRVVILDEPTAALADHDVRRLLEVLKELRADGLGLIYCSHRLEEVLELCEDVTVLRNGKMIAHRLANEFTRQELVATIVGDAASEESAVHSRGDVQNRSSATMPAVRLTGLHGTRVRDLNLELWPGEILGLAGLGGSGRSEIARMLAGVQRPNAGTIEIYGKEVSFTSARSSLKHGIALIPENRHRDGCILDLPLGANISLPTIRSFSRGGLIRRGRERESATRMTEQLRIIPRRIDLPLRLFSGGNQQKAVVGKWLLTESRIFIFDEPTGGVDVGAAREIHTLIASLTERSSSVLLICSEFEEIELLADRVLVLCDGQLVSELRGPDISKERMLKDIYAAKNEVIVK